MALILWWLLKRFTLSANAACLRLITHLIESLERFPFGKVLSKVSPFKFFIKFCY